MADLSQKAASASDQEGHHFLCWFRLPGLLQKPFVYRTELEGVEILFGSCNSVFIDFNRVPRGPYGKGFVGHCSSGHSFNPPLCCCRSTGQTDRRTDTRPFYDAYRIGAARQRLRSAQQNTLVVPRYRLTTYGRRAFSVAGPTAWNTLPVAFRDPTISDACFRRHLKTVLFAQQRRHRSV